MKKMTFDFTLPGERIQGRKAVCGVVGSGNLEVIVEDNSTAATVFTVETSVDDFQSIWASVIEEFVKEYQPIGLAFRLNDNGATAAVVSLRLRQVLELFQGYQKNGSNYLELDARERINALFDQGSFQEWLAEKPLYSPHLASLDLPGEADDGVVIGSALLNRKKVLVAAQQKDFMGGGVGEIHGAKLTGLFKAAAETEIAAVIFLIDSGGVRLHEANAGEIAISEIIRAIFAARAKGVMTIGVVCGKNGAFGGMGIISACLDYLIINEIGRIGVSGPEVIAAVEGEGTFDAQDRALVWRVYGGKTRYLQGIAQAYVGSEVASIQNAIAQAFNQPRSLDLKSLTTRHQLLKRRLEQTAGYQEEGAYLAQFNPQLAATIFDMKEQDFLAAAQLLSQEGAS